MYRRDGSSAAATTHWMIRGLGDDGARFKRKHGVNAARGERSSS